MYLNRKTSDKGEIVLSGKPSQGRRKVDKKLIPGRPCEDCEKVPC